MENLLILWNEIGHLKFAEKDLPKQEMNIELCNGI